jgi:hypothetical protein
MPDFDLAAIERRATKARPVPDEVWWTYFSSSEGAFYSTARADVLALIAEMRSLLGEDGQS